MYKTALTTKEKNKLAKYVLTSPLKTVRLKAHAVLMRDEGLELATIAKLVFRKERAVTRWLSDFSKRRLASIFTGYKNNQNAGKLTKAQKKQIKRVLKNPPSKYGIPEEFWSVPALKSYVKAEFSVVYDSDQSYHFLLRFCDLSFKCPAKFSAKRDDDLIDKRMREIKKQVRKMKKDTDKNWEIFTADETRLELECLTRRAWLRRGEKTVIKVHRGKSFQSFMGLLNQGDFKCEVYPMPWQNQDEVLSVLKVFLSNHSDRNICIIWDNATFHKGIKIRQALSTGGLLEKVHLIALPPYAPDRNPIEHVWGVAKGHLSNKQLENMETVTKKFTEYIDSRKFKYRL